MIILIQLISRFLTIENVLSLCDSLYIDRKEVLNFYFNETMYLTGEDKQNMLDNTIPPQLYMRMYRRDYLFSIILANEFLNEKVKVQIYNGIKKNIPKFLELYKKCFPMITGKSIEIWTKINKILPLLPLKIEKYEFKLSDTGEFIIFFDGKCIGRNNFCDTIKIIDHYGLDHVVTLLKNPFFLENIKVYNQCESKFISNGNDGHRRPKRRFKL